MQTRNGFSLTELMVAIGLTSIMSGVMASVLFSMTQSRVAMVDSADVSTYRMEVKNRMKVVRTDAGITQSQCMITVAPLITPAHLATIVNNMITNPADPKNFTKKNAQVNLGAVNLLGGNNLAYGRSFLQNTTFQNFRLLTSITGFRKAAPGEALRTSILQSPFIIDVIQAELHVAFGPQQLTSPEKYNYIKAIKINFALRREADGITLLDCGYRDLANITSQIELCKSFGADFEYIYDNFNGKNTGQCYAPIYDPKLGKYALSDYQNGKVMKTPTHYTPLRAFFCDLAQRGKSFNLPFCTGVN
jgi:prepilin-type N-terminal cleavage/methylation domain-containing protein